MADAKPVQERLRYEREARTAAEQLLDQRTRELEEAHREIERLRWQLAASAGEQDAVTRESPAQLDSVAENLPGIVWRRIMHQDGRVTYPYVSRKAEQLLGYLAGPTYRLPAVLFQAIHPEDQPSWEAALVRSAAELRPLAIDCRVMTAWEEWRWFRSWATPKRSADGGGLVWDGISLDVTELKRAESALSSAEARLRHVLTSSPAVLYSFEAQGDYAPTFISENVRELFGYEPGEYLAGPEFWHERVHPEELRSAHGRVL